MTNTKQSWDIYESVLLLDAYLETVEKPEERDRIVKRLSDQLRGMARRNGMEPDDTFRNTNGIHFQMLSMESAYRGETIRKEATTLLTETVQVYRTAPHIYAALLREARDRADTGKND